MMKRNTCSTDHVRMNGTRAARIFLTALFTLALVLLGAGSMLAPSAVYADTASDNVAFTYHVTVSGGLHGTVNGESQVDVQIAPGEEFNPNDYTVALNDGDDKYYFKGFHISGIEGVLEGAQPVNEDRVYVATYGIKGDLVSYTVHYVDESGNALLPSGTFYGNPGDKPVVAYQYVEGYLPQAYNLTGTLTENGPNEFTFVYSVNENAGANGAAEGAAGAVGTTSGTGVAGAAGAAGAAGDGNGPAQIIDLDDEAAPQTDGTAGGSGDGKGGEETIADDEAPQSEGSGLSTGAMVGAVIGGAAGVGFLAWLIAFLRKKAGASADQ